MIPVNHKTIINFQSDCKSDRTRQKYETRDYREKSICKNNLS